MKALWLETKDCKKVSNVYSNFFLWISFKLFQNSNSAFVKTTNRGVLIHSTGKIICVCYIWDISVELFWPVYKLKTTINIPLPRNNRYLVKLRDTDGLGSVSIVFSSLPVWDSIIKIRRSWDGLIFMLELHIFVRRIININPPPLGALSQPVFGIVSMILFSKPYRL